MNSAGSQITNIPVQEIGHVLADRATADRNALVAFLEDRDVPCPVCTYNLRQLKSVKCPECGTELRLSVGAADPSIGRWISALIGTVAPAVLGIILIIVCFAAGDVPPIGDMPADISLAMLYVLLMIPATIILLAKRRSFLRLNRKVQTNFALWPWILDATLVADLLIRSL